MTRAQLFVSLNHSYSIKNTVFKGSYSSSTGRHNSEACNFMIVLEWIRRGSWQVRKLLERQSSRRIALPPLGIPRYLWIGHDYIACDTASLSANLPLAQPLTFLTGFSCSVQDLPKGQISRCLSDLSHHQWRMRTPTLDTECHQWSLTIAHELCTSFATRQT